MWKKKTLAEKIKKRSGGRGILEGCKKSQEKGKGENMDKKRTRKVIDKGAKENAEKPEKHEKNKKRKSEESTNEMECK